ncbi:hypothetical protein ERO13_A01G177400v2 [Gossypium hirsutum]|uniref:Uncharacterized protein n=1 Tax=Gossypium barbadense TaxID=3634 RepID=A0A5J5WY84_GOSBA|nr:hypothetical protein ES319_A01G187600v1 [Gossypium barbadense]KAG4215424.1 hypothetical protein ERO13_A01G177400v2 [Gossypium hirsutum]
MLWASIHHSLASRTLPSTSISTKQEGINGRYARYGRCAGVWRRRRTGAVDVEA